jgi:hypothetical protein
MPICSILKSFDHTQKIIFNRHSDLLAIRVHWCSASPGLTYTYTELFCIKSPQG